MDIRYLEEFIALANKQNFSEVAESYYISQSTLSRHIMHLEEELHTTLFDRSKHKIELTDSGEAILSSAETIVRDYAKLKEIVNNEHQKGKDHIIIGYTSYALKHSLYNIIFDFAKLYPSVTWQFIEDNASNLTKLLENGSCDYAFIRQTYFSEEEIQNELCWYKDQFVVVLPSNHQYANAESISLEQLQGENFLIPKDHNLAIETLQTAFNKINSTPKIQTQSKTLDSILNKVSFGEGISFSAQHDAEEIRDRSNISFIKLDPPIKLATILHSPSKAEPSATSNNFFKYLQQKSSDDYI